MDLRAYLTGAPRRLLRSLITLPRPRDLGELVLAGLLLALIAGPAGFKTCLLSWHPRPWAETLALALPALIAPGLGEELAFRGLLIPDRRESASAWISICLSTALFCGWHVLEAATFLPRAWPLFTRPDFLAWTVILGLCCAALRRRSGSIWTAVILHWLAVVVWQGWLGGPTADVLR
jgi:predicted Abi (CAAX) family protease